VIRKAQEEYEERKVRYQGILLGNLPFYQDVDRAQANLLVRLAFELSYRQLCLLALFSNLQDFDVAFKYINLDAFDKYSDLVNDQRHPDFVLASQLRTEERLQSYSLLTGTHYAVRQETYDLYTKHLIKIKDDGRDQKLVHPLYLSYSEVEVVQIGKVLYALMGLQEIDRKDLDWLATLMRDDPTNH